MPSVVTCVVWTVTFIPRAIAWIGVHLLWLPRFILALLLRPILGKRAAISLTLSSEVECHVVMTPTPQNHRIMANLPSLTDPSKGKYFVPSLLAWHGRIQTLSLAISHLKRITRALLAESLPSQGVVGRVAHKAVGCSTGVTDTPGVHKSDTFERFGCCRGDQRDAHQWLLWPGGRRPGPGEGADSAVLLLCPSVLQGGAGGNVVADVQRVADLLTLWGATRPPGHESLRRHWFVALPRPLDDTAPMHDDPLDIGSAVEHCFDEFGSSMVVVGIGFGEGCNPFFKYVSSSGMACRLNAFVSISHGCAMERNYASIAKNALVHLLTKLAIVAHDLENPPPDALGNRGTKPPPRRIFRSPTGIPGTLVDAADDLLDGAGMFVSSAGSLPASPQSRVAHGVKKNWLSREGEEREEHDASDDDDDDDDDDTDVFPEARFENTLRTAGHLVEEAFRSRGSQGRRRGHAGATASPQLVEERRASSTIPWEAVLAGASPSDETAPPRIIAARRDDRFAESAHRSAHERSPSTTSSVDPLQYASAQMKRKSSSSDVTNGGRSVDALYRAENSKTVVEQISVPTLMVHANDDPVVPLHTVPLKLLSTNPSVIHVIAPHGGHCAFVETMTPLALSSSEAPSLPWLFQLMAEFIQSVTTEEKQHGRSSSTALDAGVAKLFAQRSAVTARET